MACRIMLGNQRPKRWPESRTTMVCRSLDVSRPKGNDDGFMENRRSLKKLNAGSPPLTRGDSMLNLTPERRRIVAQVRREALKNRAFLAVRDSVRRCDDLLTTTVDNDDRAGL